jgi:hypothetical protein
MHQKLKRTNTKRLASITALGAGAWGVAAPPAQANDIVFSGVINVQVPWTASSYTIPGPNGAGGVVKYNPGCQFTCGSFGHAIYIVSKPGRYGTQFRVLATGPRDSSALGEPLGAVWGTVAGKSTKAASIVWTYDGSPPATKFSATDRYMLFRFQGGALKHAFYGWARIEIINSSFEDIVDWAYTPSGIHLPAGYHGAGQHDAEDIVTPEPSTLDATGLPALALGAPGLRRFRAARTDANKQTETAL